MQLELDDAIIQSTGLTADELRLELALRLYQEEKISMGQGGHLSGLGAIRFQQELGKRNIPVNFSEGDLLHDVEMLRKAGRL